MYIAVAADNIAERKQTERLLGRANQALSKELGTLYADSYGDEASFLHACMKYDLFLIDFGRDYERSLSVAMKLKEKNAPGFIAVCKAEEDPFLHKFAELGLLTLDKPIRTTPLHEMIRQVHEMIEKKKASETIVEIRGEIETRYVNKEDIISVSVLEKEHKLLFHFVEESDFEMVGSVEDLVKLLGDYQEFRMADKHNVINDNYVIKETKKEIQLAGGHVIKRSSVLERILHHND